MIFYNSFLAKKIRKKEKDKKNYLMLGCLFFTRREYPDAWENMEMQIHEKQYWECFLPALVPALILSYFFSWWLMLLPFLSYYLLYWFERLLCSHSIFDWEAQMHSGDALYLRKRKGYAWIKGYARKRLPTDRWVD